MCHISTTTDSPKPKFGGDLSWYPGYKWLCSVCPEMTHSLRYLSHTTPIQTQTQIVIKCSITQQPLHHLTPFLFVDVALVRSRQWLCSWSLTMPSSLKNSSHNVP